MLSADGMGNPELWQTLLQLFVVILIWGIFGFFLFRRKSIRLLLMYSALFVLYFVVIILDSQYNLSIAKDVVTLFVFCMITMLIIVYQADLKTWFFDFTKSGKGVSQDEKLSDEELRNAVDEIIKACQTMSKNRTGALIVVAPNVVPSHILETGVRLEAVISASLLESIFNTKAPIHDGAVIMHGNRALAAGCFLPLSETQSVSKNLGTRHRAGIGVTEGSDMLTIIVSEETGIISVAARGELHRFVTPDRLRDILHTTLHISTPTKQRGLSK